MDCPNQKQNQMICNCTYPCGKKGICCQCVSYHRSRNELPACYFPAAAEKTYDRSLANYVRLFQQGKI